MRGLMYRDMKYVFHRTFILFLYFVGLYLLTTVVFQLVNVENAFKFYPFIVVMIGMVVFMMIQIIPGEILKTEEKKEWKYYLLSSGLGVEKIVAERYLMTFLINFGSYLFAYLMMLIFLQLADSETTAMLFGIANGIYLSMFGFNLFLQAFEMPLSYRYGSARSDKMRIAIWLLILLPAAIYLLFGNIEWLMGENGLYHHFQEYLEDPESLTVAAKAYMENLSRTAVFLFTLIPHLLVLCYYLSYKISCKVYKKGVKDHGFSEAA